MNRWGKLAITAALAAVPLAVFAGVGRAQPGADWTAFLADPTHTSVASDTTVRPANVHALTAAWTWKVPVIPGRPVHTLYSTPDVVDGVIYEGTNTGAFYAISLSTGKLVWKHDLQAYQPKTTCSGGGFVASPTAAPDPTTGKLTIYDAGGNGYLYALDAATGAVNWKVPTMLPTPGENDYFNWSSPTVANGFIYVGIASNCDNPLVPGLEMQFSQATGQLVNEYRPMAGTPRGTAGATIWSTAAATPTDVYLTTGNPVDSTSPYGDSNSIVDLDATTMAKKAIWTVPASEVVGDGDFGASPVLFTATLNGVPTQMVGACNKNGRFYALNATTMQKVWEFKVDTKRNDCVAGAVWDGSHLFVAGNPTKVNGTAYPGSIRELDPATGKPIWATGLGASVDGTPVESGGGVLAVVTWDPAHQNALYFIDPSTGAILRTIEQGKEFAQPVFADGYLATATFKGGLIAYH